MVGDVDDGIDRTDTATTQFLRIHSGLNALTSIVTFTTAAQITRAHACGIVPTRIGSVASIVATPGSCQLGQRQPWFSTPTSRATPMICPSQSARFG